METYFNQEKQGSIGCCRRGGEIIVFGEEVFIFWSGGVTQNIVVLSIFDYVAKKGS